MDIVYTLKPSLTNEELIYSLRSLCNIPHERVYFIGGCPVNLNKKYITHIPTEVQSTKYKTTTYNLSVAADLPELSEDFIWMNDDFFILHEIKNPKEELNLYKGTIRHVLEDFERRHGMLVNYMKGAQQTIEYLSTLGISNPLEYELHTPFIYNKQKTKQMLELPGIHEVPVLYKRSVYGNLYMNGGMQINDVKILRATKIDYGQFDARKFLSTSDITWNDVAPYLKSKFPDKSCYEL